MNKFYLAPLFAAMLLTLSGCEYYEKAPPEAQPPAGGSAEASYILPWADPPAVSRSVPEQSSSAPYREEASVLPSSAPDIIYEEPEWSPPEPQKEQSQAAGTELARSENYFAAPPAQDDIDAAVFEDELLLLINSEREKHGKPPLLMDDTMRFAARMRAPEVLVSLSHTRPDDTAYYTAFDEAGFAYAGKWHGENVSSMRFTAGMYGPTQAAAFMFGQLAASSGHLSNMLSDNYEQAGIGVFVQKEGEIVMVGSAQMFAGG